MHALSQNLRVAAIPDWGTTPSNWVGKLLQGCLDGGRHNYEALNHATGQLEPVTELDDGFWVFVPKRFLADEHMGIEIRQHEERLDADENMAEYMRSPEWQNHYTDVRDQGI